MPVAFRGLGNKDSVVVEESALRSPLSERVDRYRTRGAPCGYSPVPESGVNRLGPSPVALALTARNPCTAVVIRMSVIVEFTLATEEFIFGSALATVENMDIELEAIVPTGSRILPYFWATGENFEAFERHVLSSSDIESIAQLDRVEETALYRTEWAPDVSGLLNGLARTEAVVLEAMTAKGGWYFRVRFPDHDLLGRFYNFCTERDVSVHVDRVYTLTEASRAGRIFELTAEQREAIVLAVQRGYFEVPRGTDLSAIADELGISQQAASKRVRRGADKVLRSALLGPDGYP